MLVVVVFVFLVGVERGGGLGFVTRFGDGCPFLGEFEDSEACWRFKGRRRCGEGAFDCSGVGAFDICGANALDERVVGSRGICEAGALEAWRGGSLHKFGVVESGVIASKSGASFLICCFSGIGELNTTGLSEVLGRFAGGDCSSTPSAPSSTADEVCFRFR